MKVNNNGKAMPELREQRHDPIVSRNIAPSMDWGEIDESDHFVQFYETAQFLHNSVSGFIGEGLGLGEGCIVVATEPVRAGINSRLQANGIDVADAIVRGQYIPLDAAETLSKFMAGGVPELSRFVEVIGDVIKRAADGKRRVRVFGEMVAVLWAEGNCDAAIRLEKFWNDMRRTHSYTLFCAYPLNGFGGEAQAGPLGLVCAEHARVIPAESYTEIADVDDRLRAILLLQQKARTLEAEIAERREAEMALRAVKEELEEQLVEREKLLVREQMARAEAESANRLKDEFLATVSHELRTPLTAIMGWSHMLRHGRLDRIASARALETIERNAKSQAQLVEDILDVSRVITGKLRLNIGPVDMASVINAAIDSVQLAADSKGIQLEVTLDPSARHVSGDASRLQQAVWNLLSNAIKFTPTGGRVEVRLERASQSVQIRVRDTGEGVPRDFLPFIFDRFRQADGTITRKHGGLGLGLAIVRHLVELHGGTVHADSAGEGCGATFIINLPLGVASERVKGREGAEISPWQNEDAAKLNSLPSLDGIKVLLVDDDEDTINMLAVVLGEYRAGVQTASSVSQAFEILEWYKPDVLVSDLAMPGEDGYSLINRLRALESLGGRQTPAVALTAYVRVEDRARALAAGFNMFVPKPVEPNELITAIANLAATLA